MAPARWVATQLRSLVVATNSIDQAPTVAMMMLGRLEAGDRSHPKAGADIAPTMAPTTPRIITTVMKKPPPSLPGMIHLAGIATISPVPQKSHGHLLAVCREPEYMQGSQLVSCHSTA